MVRHAAKMAHEIEAAAAKTAIVKRLQLALGDRVVNIGDGTIGAAAGRDRIKGNTVVGAMDAGIDDHRAPDAKLRVQCAKILKRRIGRRIGPVRRVRVFRVRAKDMAMRVAGERWKLE
jgi:hypothetical protein